MTNHVECALSVAVQEICDERDRQVQQEGWTPEHDDEHDQGQLARAAACYILFGEDEAFPAGHPPLRYWPWDAEWWKPKDRRRDLIRSGALIIAELQRMERQQKKESRTS